MVVCIMMLLTAIGAYVEGPRALGQSYSPGLYGNYYVANDHKGASRRQTI